jgi:hypothetical protein
MALGKENSKKRNKIVLPSAYPKHSAKKIQKKFKSKKTKHALPSVSVRHWAKQFLKKFKFFCQVPRVALGKGAITATWRHGCFSLRSAAVALGKAFAEWPTCGTRQSELYREGICRQLFAECNCIRQSSCLL